MAFEFVKTQDGSAEVVMELEQGNVAIIKGAAVYYSSGYVINTTASSITCQTIAGVAAESQDNSGGSDGSVEIQVNVNPNALYEIDSNSTVAQTQVNTNCTLETNATVDEADPQDDYTGVCHISKMISTSKVLGRLNHFSPRA